jgi:hypothetical protein
VHYFTGRHYTDYAMSSKGNKDKEVIFGFPTLNGGTLYDLHFIKHMKVRSGLAGKLLAISF